MLNKIILALINSNKSQPTAMTVDHFENPKLYKSWVYPLRYVLALRYLKLKQITLKSFRAEKTYPISDTDFKRRLIENLSGKKIIGKNKKPVSALGFKAWLIYPALIIGFAYGAYHLDNWFQNRKIENVLANHLPYFSDLLHQKLMLNNQSQSLMIKELDELIIEEEDKILSDLPEKNGIRAVMAEQLKKLKEPSASSEEIMLGFKDLNTTFDKHGLKFYLTPKSFTMPCSSLMQGSIEEMMMLKKLEALMSNNNPEKCRTTMMTVYKVNKRDELFYAEQKTNPKLPLFHVERVDKVPAIDSALGLTFKDKGIGSIILTDRISNFAEESVLPALTFQGRNYIIPYWMQGYYEIEEAISKGYKKDIDDIYPSKSERLKVKNIIKKIIKNKNRMQNAKMQQTLAKNTASNEADIFGNGFDAISVLLGKLDPAKEQNKKNIIPVKELEDYGLIRKLEAALIPSIEYHEAYHQIDKTRWKKPDWVDEVFNDELTENGLDHTMEELGAYLSQLANTDKGHNIWLSKLLIFSINPMTKGQAEYYSSSLILTTLESLYLGGPIKPNYTASVEKKTEIYSIVSGMNKRDIKELAKRAYEVLFEREVPVLE